MPDNSAEKVLPEKLRMVHEALVSMTEDARKSLWGHDTDLQGCIHTISERNDNEPNEINSRTGRYIIGLSNFWNSCRRQEDHTNIGWRQLQKNIDDNTEIDNAYDKANNQMVEYKNASFFGRFLSTLFGRGQGYRKAALENAMNLKAKKAFKEAMTDLIQNSDGISNDQFEKAAKSMLLSLPAASSRSDHDSLAESLSHVQKDVGRAKERLDTIEDSKPTELENADDSETCKKE